MPRELASALEPILGTIASLTERIRDYDDRKSENLAEELYPQTGLLRQVHGVGVLRALTFVLTLEDPSRFAKSREVGAYLLGLWCPLVISREVAIPKSASPSTENGMMRRLLVSSAHYTSSVPSAKIATSGAMEKRSPGEEVRTPRRRGRWWLWPGRSSRCCCTVYGLRRRSTNRSTAPAAVGAKLPEDGVCAPRAPITPTTGEPRGDKG